MSQTFEFMRTDFSSTLFPLRTNLLVAEKHEKELSDYVYQRVLDQSSAADSFLPQQRVYATKPRGHLRRTVKLDPVAEYFIYDLEHRNRAAFRPEVSDKRRSFGYRFVEGKQISIHGAYSAYRSCISAYTAQFKNNLQFDIASYFNSLYHHDVTHWFASVGGVSEIDSNALGQFFREINSGRSVDFLPQGIYPCKMIGNEFLKFVDLHGQLKSAVLVRFMDDFTLFDDDADVVHQDFVRIQQLLGQYGLNVNPSKTRINQQINDVGETLSVLHDSLKQIVKDVVAVQVGSGVDLFEVAKEVTTSLNDEQVSSLLMHLKDESLDEIDAERILTFLRSHSDSLLEYLPSLLTRFPNLTKHVHTVCSAVTDKDSLSSVLLECLNSGEAFLEYQLFWIATMVEDYLIGHGNYGKVMMRVYELSQDFKIARAKVLEIPVQDFGFKEIRGDLLKTGQSDWLSWASAIGTRSIKAAERNYVLDYFSKGSPMNFLVASCVKKI